jgi:hypothetical protein
MSKAVPLLLVTVLGLIAITDTLPDQSHCKYSKRNLALLLQVYDAQQALVTHSDGSPVLGLPRVQTISSSNTTPVNSLGPV